MKIILRNVHILYLVTVEHTGSNLLNQIIKPCENVVAVHHNLVRNLNNNSELGTNISKNNWIVLTSHINSSEDYIKHFKKYDIVMFSTLRNPFMQLWSYIQRCQLQDKAFSNKYIDNINREWHRLIKAASHPDFNIIPVDKLTNQQERIEYFRELFTKYQIMPSDKTSRIIKEWPKVASIKTRHPDFVPIINKEAIELYSHILHNDNSLLSFFKKYYSEIELTDEYIIKEIRRRLE